MRSFFQRIGLAVVLCTLSSSAHAQGIGYAIAGVASQSGFFGSRSNTFHAAGGGDLLVADRFGIGGELGFFNRLLVGSFTGSLRFPDNPTGKVVPFVLGGYSRMGIGDGEGAFNAWNLGGGLDYWTGSRMGVRVEFRDHVRPDERGTVQYWSLRGGVVFR